MKKPFSPSLHEKNDQRARDAARGYIQGKMKNVRVYDNPDRYGIDLLCKKNGKIAYMIDVEVKDCWSNTKFPFKTVNLPTRKEKFKSSRSWFFIFNRFLNRFISIKSALLKGEYKKEVKNKYVKSGEIFFQIPLEMAKEIST